VGKTCQDPATDTAAGAVVDQGRPIRPAGSLLPSVGEKSAEFMHPRAGYIQGQPATTVVISTSAHRPLIRRLGCHSTARLCRRR
jgi:hypothetical protein